MDIIRILKGNFGKHVMMITSGTVFAQLLTMLLSPIITRLYTPEEYGILAIFTAIFAVVGIMGSMNYEMGIPISESDEKAVNVLSLSVITLFFAAGMITLILYFSGDELLGLLNGEALINYIYFIPIAMLLVGLYTILNQWAYRDKDFTSITKTKYSQAISQNGTTIVLGYLGLGAVGLLVGRIVGQSAGITTFIIQFIKKDKPLLKKITLQDMMWALKRFRTFPLFTTPRRFLGDLAISLPILFLGHIYGIEIVGQFGLAYAVIQVPMNLIGSSISSVFYSEAASLRYTNPTRIKVLSNKLLKMLIIIGLIPSLTLLCAGPYLFSFIFGDKWMQAGIYAQLLSIAVFCRFAFKPISNIFDIFEKQKIVFWLSVVNVLIIALVFMLSKYLNLSAYLCIGMYSVFMSAIYVCQYRFAQKILDDEIIVQHSEKV